MNKLKQMSEHKGKQKTIVGKVISAKTPNTVIVAFETEHRHPLYGKVVRKTKHMAAHYDNESPRLGNTVRIAETKPITKTKHFKVIEILG